MNFHDVLAMDFNDAHPELTAAELEQLNAENGGLDRTLGATYTLISPSKVVLELEIGEQHLQPAGLVNGGVYCSLVESSASIAGMLAARSPIVGVNNNTNFLSSAREGKLVATATPIHTGRRSQLWNVDITNADKLIARGTLRTMVMSS